MSHGAGGTVAELLTDSFMFPGLTGDQGTGVVPGRTARTRYLTATTPLR